MKPNKFSIFGINYSATNYHEASDLIIEQAKENRSYTVSALAVHGLIEAYRNIELRKAVNNIDLVVPDGQPIKWALNSFYKLSLSDRVCGPDLTLHVLEKASKHHLKLFLYGSTRETLNRFSHFIEQNYGGVEICGVHPDRFREATVEEDLKDIEMINNSGAHLIFIGRGCPRQEYWVENHKNKIRGTMMAIGAAFDFHALTEKRAPKWIRDKGLEWLFRLLNNPKRLWKRYFISNSLFIYLFLKHKLVKK